MRADPWYGTIFSIFRTNCAILTLYIRADPRTCRGLSPGCCHVVWWNWWELRDSLADFSQRWQAIGQRRRTRALLCTFMLWFNGKGVFFRVENFFNFALWMNKIRSPANYRHKLLCLFCREKFCKKTAYPAIELICEFAKIWLIITKTCFDSFLLFLLVWLRCKSFWKAVWRVLVVHHSRSQRPRSFWSAPRIATSGQVQHRKSAIHGLPVTLRMFRVKFGKSDWLWSQSIVFTKRFKNGMSLD